MKMCDDATGCTQLFRVRNAAELGALIGIVCLAVLAIVWGLLILGIIAELRKERRVLKWEADHTVVEPARLPEARFHAFLSHNWASGQDQARGIKELMQALVPGLKVPS